MTVFCQWIVALSSCVGFLGMAYTDFNGRPAMRAGGFPGFVGTLVVYAIQVAVLCAAGAFSEILP